MPAMQGPSETACRLSGSLAAGSLERRADTFVADKNFPFPVFRQLNPSVIKLKLFVLYKSFDQVAVSGKSRPEQPQFAWFLLLNLL